MPEPVCETPRLLLRLATPEDAGLVHALWTDPRVMTFVGFPHGLSTTVEQIRANILQRGPSEFEQLLIVILKDSGQTIGQCKMERPGEDGISETDIKLFPEFWGHGFGVEVKRALCGYFFANTDCSIVQATPNVQNIASIKMQEAVGGIRVGENLFEFPPGMQADTTPVHSYVYHVRRQDWEQRK